MEKIRFYYDESEHSRKVTKSTINASNFSANFVAGIIGYKQTEEENILSEYLSFEEKHKKFFSVHELKSTIIRPSQIQYGFSSLNENNIRLLDEYMNFFIKHDLYCYFAVINKIEYIVLQLFSSYRNSLFIDMDIAKYIITKVINVYRPELVIEAIYRNDGTFVIHLINFIKSQLKKNIDLHHKEDENRAFKQLLQILTDYNMKFIINWNYMIAFDGFKKYIEENNIKNYELFIDQEGDGNTTASALYIGLINVKELDSQQSAGIRISDFFVGLISKFVKALDKELHYSSEKEVEKKKLLSKQWFKINKTHFQMYSKWQSIIVNQHLSFHKTYTGNYSDIFISFICFLNYISSYRSIEDYNRIDVETHQNNFNNMVVGQIYQKGEEIKIKIPFEKIQNTEKDFYLTQKGLKVYKDYTKHKRLIIPTDSMSRGIVYDVLAVGFIGVMEHPCITVKEGEKPVLYLLPDDYREWATMCLGFAMSGNDIFPTQVRFFKENNQYYVDVL